MMQKVSGVLKDSDLFGDLQPVDTLIWYDGPMTFTLRDKCGNLHLAHWADLDHAYKTARFMVVPTTAEIVERLSKGLVTIREVLSHPYVYIVDQDYVSGATSIRLSCLSEVPEDYLPKVGVML